MKIAITLFLMLIIVEGSFFWFLARYFKTKGLFFTINLVTSILVYAFFAFKLLTFNREEGTTPMFYWSIGFFLLIFIPKLIAVLFWVLGSFSQVLVSNIQSSEQQNAGRRKIIKQLGLGLAAIPFVGLLHGMWKGKYRFRILTHSLEFVDLPIEFNGFKILQISDLHSGSFDNAEKIEYAVNLINDQEADLLLFTGDIVNTKASEFDPWVDTFKRLRDFKFGKFSVLGNHDYGEYVTWPSAEAKNKNFEAIKALHKKVNFELLCNENRTLVKEDSSIKLIGVENWGRNFKKAGNLPLASKGINKNDFKVLMSHDPSHWEYDVKNNNNNYQLTLSGHTHGLQFGIEIPGIIKWSPIQYVYKQWAGIYKHKNRYINVNRGFGFHAFPGRVGIWPEITVLELKRKV